MRKVLSMLLAGAMALSLTACGSGQGQTQNGTQAPSTSQETAKAAGSQNTKPADGDFASQGYRIAYILNVASSDIFQMAVSEAKATAEAMGMTVDVYFADTDNVKFQDYVNTCAGQDYDAMFLSTEIRRQRTTL